MRIDIEDFELAVAERFRGVLSADMPTVSPPTARALARLLASRLQLTERRVSLTARAFYRIRAMLALQLGVASTSIHPGTRLRDLMPDASLRRAQWTRVCASFAIPHSPGLARSERLAWTLAIGIAILTLVAGIAAAAALSTSLIIPSVLLTGGCLTALGLRATRRGAQHFVPPDLAVGALVAHAVAYGSPMLAGLSTPATPSQVLEVVQALVQLEIGTPIVDPDATWEDLVSLARAS